MSLQKISPATIETLRHAPAPMARQPQPHTWVHDVVAFVDCLPEIIVGVTTLSAVSVGLSKMFMPKPLPRKPQLSESESAECDRLEGKIRLMTRLSAVTSTAMLPSILYDAYVSNQLDGDNPHGATSLTSERLLSLGGIVLVTVAGFAAIISVMNTTKLYEQKCVNQRPNGTESVETVPQHSEFCGLPEAINPTAVGLSHTMFTPSGRPHSIDWNAAGQAALIVGGAALLVAAVIATDGAALAIIPAL